MKNFEINSLGMQEMTVQETRNTEGGSVTVLLICAAATLLLASCGHDNTFDIRIFNGNRGGNVNAQVGINANETDSIK